jgi:predicted NBD/HSP70 family sugar kinase/biotin operon repressor
MTAGPATSRTLKEINLRTVFQTIRAERPVSRAQLARRTGISKPTVSALLQDLLEMGLVAETGPQGRPAQGPTYGALFFSPRPDAAHVLGLDMGARRLRGVLADLEGTVLIREDVDVDGQDAPRVVAASARLADRLAAEAGLPRTALRHAAVGVPGVVDRRRGRLAQALNVPALDGFPAEAEFRSALRMPVTVENDINLAALGERWCGLGRDAEDFAFVSIGTGVGAGLVLRGELHRGFSGAAGELDYAIDQRSQPDNDPCAPALLRYARARLQVPADGPPLTTERVFALAREGHPGALAVLDEEARRITGYIAPLAAVADVELVVLGGGIGLNGDLLLDRVSARLAGRVPYPPRLAVSGLGSGAVLSGAVAVAAQAALEQILTHRFHAPL